MKNPTNEKTASVNSSAKLRLTKETVKGLGLSVRTGIRAATGPDQGAGGSCAHYLV